MAGAADEAEVSVPALEHVHDRLRRGGLRPFRLDDEWAGGAHVGRATGAQRFLAILNQGVSHVLVQRNPAPGFSLTGGVEQANFPSYLALGIIGHPPGQLRDLLGPETGFHREQEDEAIALRVPRGGEVGEHRVNLALAKRLGLFSQSHSVLLTRYLWAAGSWTVI